ncbi:MAG: hypothetical protein IAE98_05330, partial [Candidatus Kapabacteria bacterium]|nr:hypothetical protein [Candidatus Kapabacteria bacterium]
AYSHDCKIYCDHINWVTHTDSSNVVHYNGCVFTVYWSYRYAKCEGIEYCQFKIDKISQNSTTPGCEIYIQDPYALSMKAAKEILFQNGYDTPCASGLEPDSCKVNLAVSKSACFQYTNSGPSGPTDLVPCLEKSICCHSTWKLCLDSKGNPLEPVQISQNGINPICPSGECFGICDEEEKK